MNMKEALEKKEIIESLMQVIEEYNRLVPELLTEIERLRHTEKRQGDVMTERNPQ